jgi:hypothetical protein
MSNQKRLSQLSLAAVALFAAALPCLAQTESGNARQAVVLNQAQAGEIAALGSERLSVHKAAGRATADARVIEKQKTWSRAQFEQSIERATVGTPLVTNVTNVTNPAISENGWEKTRRLANDDESTSAKRITFVPSKGQRLPQS